MNASTQAVGKYAAAKKHEKEIAAIKATLYDLEREEQNEQTLQAIKKLNDRLLARTTVFEELKKFCEPYYSLSPLQAKIQGFEMRNGVKIEDPYNLAEACYENQKTYLFEFYDINNNFLFSKIGSYGNNKYPIDRLMQEILNYNNVFLGKIISVISCENNLGIAGESYIRALLLKQKEYRESYIRIDRFEKRVDKNFFEKNLKNYLTD